MNTKRRLAVPGGLVPHPRFAPRADHARIPIAEAEIRRGFWRLRRAVIFPESVIVANVMRQHYAIYPRRYYVDVLENCRECGLPFLFFAREQKFWYEELGFHVEACATLCSACRQRAHARRALLARYAEAVREAKPSGEALLSLVDIVAGLAEAGVLKRVERLGALKNRALRQCGENPRIERLAAVAARLRVAQQPAK